MKTKKINLILGILMFAALLGAMMLVRQNQNTRRGAYFSGTNILVMPESLTATVGTQAIAQLYLETQDGAKLSSLDTVVCYGSGLSLDINHPEGQVILNTAVLKDLIDVSLVTINSNSCVRIIGLAGATMNPDLLKSGMVKVADIKFDATAVASGKIFVLADKTKVGGYNPAAGATDTSLKVNSVIDGNYTIIEPGTGVTPTTVVPTSSVPTTVPTNIVPTSSVPTSSVPTTVVPTSSVPTTVVPTKVPTSSVPTTVPTTVVPTSSVPTTVSGINPVLKFKLAFFGVAGNAMCNDAVNDLLMVTVRAPDGTTKTYNNVLPVKASDTADLGIFEVTVPLVGIGSRDNLAVFVKSPKSLQVKYGVNNQSTYYGVAGGEISGLTNNESSTPVFDFSGYPLLMGDVVGANSETQDGVVDGLDFSYIKSEANKRTEVAEHGYMNSDLNGNCKMESQDLANMMISLSVKQGQLY